MRTPFEIGVVEWAPGDERLAAASAEHDATVMIWNAEEGKSILEIHDQRGMVYDLSWSASGDILAAIASDGTVKGWRTEDGAKAFELKGYLPAIYGIDLSHNGALLAATGYTGMTTLWNLSQADLDNTTSLHSWFSHGGYSTKIEWSHDDDLLLIEGSTYREGRHIETTTIWDNQGNLINEHILGRENCPQSYWKPGEDTVLIFQDDGWIEYKWASEEEGRGLVQHSYGRPKSKPVIWEPTTGHIRDPGLRYGVGEACISGSWSPDRERIVTYVTTGKVIVWNATTGEALTIREQPPTGGRESPIVWSPNGSKIALCGSDLVMVNASNLETLWQRPIYEPLTAEWSPDSSWIALSRIDGSDSFSIIDALNGTIVQDLFGHNGRVTSISWSQDGSVLASGSSDGTVLLWREIQNR